MPTKRVGGVSGPRHFDTLKTTLHLQPEPTTRAKRRLVGVARHATLVNTLVQPPELDVRFEGE